MASHVGLGRHWIHGVCAVAVSVYLVVMIARLRGSIDEGWMDGSRGSKMFGGGNVVVVNF